MSDLNKPAVSQPDYDSKRLKRYGGMSGQVFCLDSEVSALEAENERLRKLLGMAHCPNCDGSGAIVHQFLVPACCGNYLSTGECCGNAAPEEAQEVEQCQWCAEQKAILNREQEKQP